VGSLQIRVDTHPSRLLRAAAVSQDIHDLLQSLQGVLHDIYCGAEDIRSPEGEAVITHMEIIREGLNNLMPRHSPAFRHLEAVRGMVAKPKDLTL